MPVSLRFIVEGEVVVSRSLDGLAARMTDLTGAWDPVIATFRRIVKRAFDTEGASTANGPWGPLALATQRDRARQHFGPRHPILRRTSTLERSLTTDQGLGFSTKTPTSLAIGTNDPKFKYHQSPRPRTKLPRRAPVSFTEQDRQDLMAPVVAWVLGRDPNAPRRERPAAAPVRA